MAAAAALDEQTLLTIRECFVYPAGARKSAKGAVTALLASRLYAILTRWTGFPCCRLHGEGMGPGESAVDVRAEGEGLGHAHYPLSDREERRSAGGGRADSHHR